MCGNLAGDIISCITLASPLTLQKMNVTSSIASYLIKVPEYRSHTAGKIPARRFSIQLQDTHRITLKI